MRKPTRYRDKMPVRHSIPLTILGLLIFYFAWAWLDKAMAAQPGLPDQNLIEADLTHHATNPDLREQIVEYEGFTVSFNPDMHIPNWVSWELTADETSGPAKRRSKFTSDPKVTGCPTTNDYKGSGYDRGHLCPAGDMKWSQQAMTDCFNLTNICPQTRQLNSGWWKVLEEESRQTALRDSILIIIAGPVLTDLPEEYIGQNQVAVPSRFFKILLTPSSCPPRAIGFILSQYENISSLAETALPIDSIEAITGHNFFPTLTDSLQNIIESQCQFQKWEMN